MVLKRIWSVGEERGKDVIRLSKFKEYRFRMEVKEAGHYHFVCGLPHVLNVNKIYRKSMKDLRLPDKISKMTQERARYSLKLKIKVFNQYVVFR